MRNNKKLLLLCVLASIISSFALVITPYFLGKAIDGMVGYQNVDLQFATKMLSYTAVAYFMHFILSWATNRMANRFSVRFVSNLRSDLMKKITHLPISFIDQHAHGDLQNLFVMDSELIIDGMYLLLTQFLGGVFVVLVAAYYMIRINLVMSLVVFVMVPIVYFTSKLISRKSFGYFQKQQELSGKLSGKTSEFVDNYHLVLTSNYKNQAIQEFSNINNELNKVGEKAQFMSALTNPTTRLMNNLSYVLLGLTGAFGVLNNTLTVGLMTSFLSYSMMFSKPFNEFSAIISQIIAAKASYQRQQKVFNETNEVDCLQETKLEGKTVAFEDVNFSYDGKHTIIENLNLQINPLSKVAIVGPTGAGKSTLLNLLMRYYDADSGSILIDGLEVNDVSRSSIRQTMSIVLQDPWLFEGTIRENISYGNEKATEEEIIRAAKQAGCHDYIMSLDGGYDSPIKLGSQNISLGQKQLITIARALLMDVPIIILDEATSSVDVVTERHIQNVFTQIMKSHTTFFVAHRLSTVTDSDMILVMKSGRLVEQGTHEELMELRGFYYELYTSQY
ncbi:ABC transporter ATP-binding protein [Erysipelothrix sp. strain 2 (EsS2-6-Brazil)]|nr:ABC transporter ATP-binding protein [Erysipelothrix sp. strain 2 (EsS2-6-Brazil)]MBK2402704.1 ABC transporter ATP-binding protein [Erysipelothrix sp. strain 2 (EsS2-6-Brazil)]NBA01610.1 ATP-binding cassette domain-containing protein [Erysipelothrix rhusiopathiae]